VANGALSIDGRRHRLGGLRARGLRVAETADGCEFSIPGQDGLMVQGSAQIPPQAAAGWRYSDPDGGEHDVVNCSVSSLELTLPGLEGGTPRRLATPHGAAYELGMRERDHGVPIAPFSDG
jgi:hypothetical protein